MIASRGGEATGRRVDTPGLEWGGLEVIIDGKPYLRLERGVCAACGVPVDFRYPMYGARGCLSICVRCRPLPRLRAWWTASAPKLPLIERERLLRGNWKINGPTRGFLAALLHRLSNILKMKRT